MTLATIYRLYDMRVEYLYESQVIYHLNQVCDVFFIIFCFINVFFVSSLKLFVLFLLIHLSYIWEGFGIKELQVANRINSWIWESLRL